MFSSSLTEPPGWMMTADPGGGGRLDAVGERVERVAGARAAGGPTGRLGRGDLTGLDPVLLAGADAPRPCRPSRARSSCDFTQPHDPPGQLGVGPLLPRWARRLVTTRQSSRVAAKWWASCTRQTAVDLADLASVGRRAAAPSSRRVFLRFARERVDHAGAVAGRDDDVGLRGRDHALDGGVVDRVRFRATMPPNAERSSHSKARWYASASVSATAARTGWRA